MAMRMADDSRAARDRLPRGARELLARWWTQARVRGVSTGLVSAQDLLDAVPAPMFLRDRRGRYLRVNRAWEQLTGVARRDAVGTTAEAVWPIEIARVFTAANEQALRDGAHTTQTVAQTADGSERVLLTSWVPVRVAGRPATAGVGTDITELVTGRADHEWLAALVASTADAVVGTRNETIVSWNTAAEQILGYPARDAIGHSWLHLGSALAGDPKGWEELIDRVRAGKTIRGQEMTWWHPDGQVCTVSVTATPVPADASGARGTSWIVRDAGERVRHQLELEHLAGTDELTGLPNRRSLTARLTGPAVPGGEAVLVVDVDDFSGVNDKVGHLGGDRVLATIATRIRAAVRPGDFVARVGGDEFVVHCPGADVHTARQIAERIGARVDTPIGHDLVAQVAASTPLRLTGSIGVATTSTEGVMGGLRDADVALWAAKRGGAGRIVIFDPSVHQALRRRRQLTEDLLGAAEHDQLHVVYQPVIRLREATLAHVEALLRWEHPRLGTVSPQEFIPLAESTHAIHTIGTWVLQAATRQAAGWQNAPGLGEVGVAVNVSARQLTDPTLPTLITDALTRSGLPARLLTLEVTETALVDDLDAILPALHALRALGVGLSMDDFGTGYSSLSYLHRLPVTQIKIDQSITADLSDDPAAVAIVDSLSQLAETLGLQVVAEGIETPEQHARLASLGVGLGQGWLYAHPVEPQVLTHVATQGQPPWWQPATTNPRLNPPAASTGRPSPEPSRLVGTYTIDRQRLITSWDAAASQMTGYPPIQAVGRNCRDGLLVHSDENGQILCGDRCPLLAVMNDGEARTARVFYRHAGGHRVPAQVRGEPLRDHDGNIVGAVEMFTDDTPHRHRVEDVHRARTNAHTDTLTGLPNQRRARIALTSRLAHPRGQTPAAIGIHLRSLDTPGAHPEPDYAPTVLRVVAATLSGAVRTGDFLARTGPSDFLILTATDTPADLRHYTNMLRRHLHATTPHHHGQPVQVGASITATLINPEDTANTILTRIIPSPQVAARRLPAFPARPPAP